MINTDTCRNGMRACVRARVLQATVLCLHAYVLVIFVLGLVGWFLFDGNDTKMMLHRGGVL